MILEDAMVRAHGKKTRPCSILRGTWPNVDAGISDFVTILHPARIVKCILFADMDVLEFLPGFRVIVCKLCQSAIRPSAVSTHLRRVHARYNSNPTLEKQIRKFTNEILPRFMETSLLDPRIESVIVPAIEQTPLPHLRIYDGFGCSCCPLVSQAVHVMRNHYNITHALERRSRGGRKCSVSRAISERWRVRTLERNLRGKLSNSNASFDLDLGVLDFVSTYLRDKLRTWARDQIKEVRKVRLSRMKFGRLLLLSEGTSTKGVGAPECSNEDTGLSMARIHAMAEFSTRRVFTRCSQSHATP